MFDVDDGTASAGGGGVSPGVGVEFVARFFQAWNIKQAQPFLSGHHLPGQ